MNLKRGQSMANWNPGSGPNSRNHADKLMSTEARDCPDCISATNDLKEFQGKSGKPPGELGKKGKSF